MKSPRPDLCFVPVRYYDAAVRYLASRGHDGERLVRGTGVSLAHLATDGAYLTLDQTERLVRRAIELEPGDEMPLEVGRRFQLASHGALGMAALSAPDLEHAIAIVVRYFALVTPLFAIALRKHGDGFALRLDARWPLDRKVERFHVAAMCGSLYAQGAFLLGGGLPPGFEVDSRLSRPPNLPAWVDESGVRVTFDRPDYEVRFPAAFAAKKSPLADASAHALACKTCDASLASSPDPSRTSSSVRHHLVQDGPPYADLDAVAAKLFVSARTLRRRLADEGTSFRELLEEVRIARADAWLRDGERSITEIGYALGYADGASFTRAYRRARGVSPREARRAPS